jgi:hypothetical protein
MTELTKRIVAYEQGRTTHDETVVLFQELFDSGIVWDLQGHYGRRAYEMLQEGLINERP